MANATYEVTEEIMKHITDTVTPQGIAAVVALPDSHRLTRQGHCMGMAFLDRVQDQETLADGADSRCRWVYWSSSWENASRLIWS